MKYRKKPVVIEAVEWTGENLNDIKIFMQGSEWGFNKLTNNLTIHTLEGNMEATVGDFIIKGVKGEHYPCKPNIFELTYEQYTE